MSASRSPPEPAQLAAAIKALPLLVTATAPMEEAISTAGGVALPELDENFMVRRQPGLFCAGEMLDWEAPTGGYLLTACLATGHQAGLGMARWLKRASADSELRPGLINTALAARAAMLKSGEGYDASDVRTYVQARLAGDNPALPPAKMVRLSIGGLLSVPIPHLLN